MTITITAGWWMIPTLITAVVWLRALWDIHKIRPSHVGYAAPLEALVYAGLATILSLAAWLIWALTR